MEPGEQGGISESVQGKAWGKGRAPPTLPLLTQAVSATGHLLCASPGVDAEIVVY